METYHRIGLDHKPLLNYPWLQVKNCNNQRLCTFYRGQIFIYFFKKDTSRSMLPYQFTFFYWIFESAIVRFVCNDAHSKYQSSFFCLFLEWIDFSIIGRQQAGWRRKRTEEGDATDMRTQGYKRLFICLLKINSTEMVQKGLKFKTDGI